MKAANETDQFITENIASRRRVRAILNRRNAVDRCGLNPTAVRHCLLLDDMLADELETILRFREFHLSKEPTDATVLHSPSHTPGRCDNRANRPGKG